MSDIVRDIMKLCNPEDLEAANATDTSAEAVKQLIAGTNGIPAFAAHNDTLRALLAERDAAVMDADMQAREAGTMEHNARVLMAERDRLREALAGLLGVTDWANAALARGEDEQWVHTQLMQAAGNARAALKDTGHE